MKKLLFSLLLLAFSVVTFSQGSNCISADPFCTGTTYSFPNNINTSSESGPNYGCLSTQPNPAWYYLQIDQSGNLDITISQVNGGGSGIDVDFICWGPFSSPTTPCTASLTSGNTVDCSYSSSATEIANIPSAVSGQYYLLLITNYANESGNITFSQTGGSGSTDCSIVTPSCPTVGFHGEDNGGNTYNLPLALGCDIDGWLFLRANDASTAGGPITPTAVVNVSTNGNSSGNNIYGYENNSGTWNAYWSSSNLPSATNYSFTMYEMDNVTASSFGIEMCDVNSGSDMSYTIQDGNCGSSTIATGTWSASDGSNSGSAGPTGNPSSGGCQFVTFPTSAVSGTASFTCPTCPPSSFVPTSYGWAYFNPAEAGPGAYNITYSWDDGCGCSGSATETITVNNPFDASFNYSAAQFCSSGTDPSPTVTQTGGTFSSTPAGLSINTSTGAIDVSASTQGAYTVTYTIGAGTTDYSGSCNDSHSESVSIAAPPTSNAGSDLSITCSSNVGGAPIGSTASAGLSYSWSPTSGLSSSTVSNPTANPTSTTTYTLTTTISGLPGCSATDNVTVTVNNTPPTANAGTDVSTTCTTPTASLTGSASGGSSPYSYSWNNGAGATQNPTVNPATTTTYTLTVTGANGCTDTDDVLVTVDETAPTANAGSDVTTTCTTPTASLTGSSSGGSSPYSYSWNNGAGATQNPTVNPATSTTYTLTVTGANGCTDTDDVVVTVDKTAPTANAGSDVTTTCTTPTASLTGSASGGSSPYSYSWNNGAGATQNPTVNPATTTTYTLTVTGANGCTDTDDVIVTVDKTAPTANAGSDVIIDCNSSLGQEILDGSASSTGMTYAWSTGGGNIVSGGNTNSATIDTDGTYTLTVLNPLNGCSASDNALVSSDFSTPTASIAPPTQIDCISPSTTVDGSASVNNLGSTAGLTYSWSASNGGVISGSSTNSSVTATSAGDYTLVVTQANGCTESQTVTVTADASVPTAIITGTGTLNCTVSSINLDGSTSSGGPLTYEWLDGSSTPIGTGSSVSINAPDTYTLIVTNTSSSCTNSTNVIITQDLTPPTVLVNTPVVIDCYNPNATLDATGSSTGANFNYSWTASGSGSVIGAGANITDSTNVADTYNILITNSTNGCSASGNVVVTEDTGLPTADAGADVNFPCGVVTVSLDGSASSGTGISYSWSGPGNITNGSTPAPDIDATGTYTLTVTGANGCSASDNVDVIPDSNAPIADAGQDIIITCNDLPWNVVLDGSNSDAGANITYSWSVISGSGIISNGTTISPNVDQAGTYQITVTNTTNSCFSSDIVTVSTDTLSPVANAGSDQTITCTSGLVTNLDGNNSIGTNLIYNWTTTTGVINSQNGSSAVVSASGTYTLTVTGDNGCNASDEMDVSMDTVTPLISAINPGTIDCIGTPITIDASGTSASGATFLWSDNSSGTSLTVTSAGTYSLTVTNANGCSTSSSFNVSAVSGPLADFSATPTSGNIPLDVSFTDQSIGNNLTYSWDFGDGNSSGTTNPMNTYTTTGDFIAILTVTDNNSCTDTASVTIHVDGESELIIPNVFSPNGDGSNDIFSLNGTNIIELTGVIYNRWGQVIYRFDSVETGWDGHTIAGVEASEGTYFYIIDAVGADGKEHNFQGHLQLIR